jgi:hypothetical protein
METRYCIEYINPQHPLREDGSLNIRYDRVLTLEQAEHDLTLIRSFGGKILDLYMGNAVDGETGEWNPKPMQVDNDDWFSPKWLKALKYWLPIDKYPLEKFVEVLAFNKEWIHEDKCPNGIRIGFLGEDGFISATWNMEQDCYDTVYEQGDDYYKGNAYVIEEEKKKALPNMPTHYMIIPNYKAQRGE